MTESPADRRYREGMALNDVLARAEERTAARLRKASGAPVRYAWCFDHGRLHAFDPDTPWCTARWAWLDGDNETLAIMDKRLRYGDAQFLHELPNEQQLVIINECAGRREAMSDDDGCEDFCDVASRHDRQLNTLYANPGSISMEAGVGRGCGEPLIASSSTHGTARSIT